MSKRVTVRLPEEDARLLEEASRILGDSKSNTMRAALRYLCLEDKPRVDHVYYVADPSLQAMQSEFARQGNNLNQIARKLHAQGAPAETLERINDALETLQRSHESIDEIMMLTAENMKAVPR